MRKLGFARYSILVISTIGSLQLGASLVHNYYKPDLTIPQINDSVDNKKNNQ